MIESQKEEICRIHQGDERRRQHQQLLHEQLLEQNRDLRGALERFQGSTFDTSARKKLVEDRDTILEFTGESQELQNEINCKNDSRVSRRDQSTSVFPTTCSSGCNAKPFSGIAEPKMGRQAFGTHMVYRETFLKIQMRPLQHLILKNCISGIHRSKSRSIHPQWRKVKGKNKIKIWDASQDRQPEIQSSQVREIFSKNYGADQQRLQISDLHFDKFRTPATFACWKIRFKVEVCICSHFLAEAMLWIQEVEMVDSVNDLMCSSSIRGNSNAELWSTRCKRLLQHWTESSIILTSKESVWRNKRPRSRTVSYEEDRSLSWSTSTSGSLGPMILSKTTPTYLLLVFEMMIFRNSIQSGTEFFLSMTRIPSDEILEGLYKLRIRESEKLKTVLELYDLETHQKKLGPDYHRLKTMVKRSIEQDIRNKNFGARSGNFEKNAVVKNQGTNSLNKELRRLLAMRNQRAVCERRQLQFPPRYQ